MTGKTKIILSFSASILILIVVGIYAFLNINKYKSSSNLVQHTQEVILKAQHILSAMQEVETSQRNFVITGKEESLKRYYVGVKQRDNAYSELKHLVRDNKTQTVLLDTVYDLYVLKTEFAQKAIIIRRDQGFEAAKNFTSNGMGELLMDDFRKKIEQFVANERQLLAVRLNKLEDSFTNVVFVIVGSVLLSIMIMVATLYFFIKDHNKRHASERRMRENDLRTRNILNTLPVGVFIINKDATPYYANSKAREILGSDFDISPGTNYTIGLFKAYIAGTDQDYPKERRPLLKALEGETNLGIEDMEIERDGVRVPLRINAIPIYNSQQEMEYAVGVFEDISAIKLAENELIRSRKLAEASLVLKETFLANMSHEIRTPMNAIIGFTDLLSKVNLGPLETDYVKIIKASGENLLRIINDILDISKIEAGMMAFEEYPLSINGIFKSLETMLLPKANEKNIKLHFTTDNDIPETLLGDPVRLTQILINLAGNAIKFTERGEVRIFAKLQQLKDQCIVSFSVKDTGIGIAPNKLQSIFERFSQAEHSTTRNYGGTGLGLSIAKQLIELQCGVLDVQSAIGVGSVFNFTLPFKIGDKNTGKSTLKANVDFEALKKLRLLVVEDNPINSKLLQSLFSNHNISIDLAGNGRIAIEKILANTYDLVLMDMEMPELNGYDTTIMLRRDMQNKIPIIAMTAHAMAGEREKCLRLGMNEYISKPIIADLLFEKIYRVAIAFDKTDSEQVSDSLQPVASGNRVVNLDTLREFSGGDKTFEQEMMRMFIDQMGESLQILSDAFVKNDTKIIKATAHKMKSSVSIVGVDALFRYLSDIELNTSDNVSDHIGELIQAVKVLLDKCFKDLNRLLEQES